MSLGDQIKALRKAQKMTQEQLAEYLNVSSQAVSKWETGASSPDVDTLPKLALLFHTSMDELFEFDQTKVRQEVDALVRQSVPLRAEPERAEAFYRQALERYPNNEILLNCLLMSIPNERSAEKIELGERLLDCTSDDEIRFDVLRLLALTYHGIGQDAMAEHCLARLPELYFLKNEIAAAIRRGEAQEKELFKTERICLWTLASMLALRQQREASPEFRAENAPILDALSALINAYPEHREMAKRLEDAVRSGQILDQYQ